MTVFRMFVFDDLSAGVQFEQENASPKDTSSESQPKPNSRA
jgi:hypothetical protein